MATTSKNVDTIKTSIFLTDDLQLRSFLGACIVYERFTIDFSKFARPRNDYLRKVEGPGLSVPKTDTLDAFSRLNSRLMKGFALALP